ncbi:glycosyltransferase [Variovorax sp. J22R115]|uniref:glycosyltransferase n=1 Tax=Variovorax sp. J22R115 TaxID=3053509 RepID=UPI00257679D6|nr:glycosyltransferase [Variovorax sp. J22R115]MDM0049025.1 glycosyltransferase [Variovorax sp. J22R115]
MKMPGATPDISIVINTLNRGASLNATLESFQWLRYSGRFEVIVVNGPSTDNSEEVIAKWGVRIRSARCPVANLSVSRNIGICLARGDITAFIDDDAIPEPEWLEQLAAAYEDPQVGGAGGFVFDHTGYSFQYGYGVVDRFGKADINVGIATPHLSYPNSPRFPHLLGANSSFRTSALLEIGGFDEEFEYFLDETDVCARIVDAGYLIAQLPNAFVHHKYAASNIRGTNRVPRYRYPIIKNKIYFMFKHARRFHPLDEILGEQVEFLRSQRNEMQWALSHNLVTAADVATFESDLERAMEVGMRRGAEGPAPDSMIDDAKRMAWPGEFSAFTPHSDIDECTLVLISKSFAPAQSGGIATFSKDLAEAYASRGNIVHLIAESNDVNRVDFENGVWIHRIIPKTFERPPEVVRMGLPQHIWNWSASAFEEARRIATHRTVHVVEAPIWDCEGIAFLLDRQWPLVTSLHTTLHFWLDSHPEHRSNIAWMTHHGTPMLQAERRLMQESDGVRANSQAIRGEIEKAYGFRFDDSRTQVIPHGMKPVLQTIGTPPNEAPVVLFVGRLEPRKGIDVLLDAIPQVLESAPSVRFRIVGDKTQLSPTGRPYADDFLSSKSGARWRNSVAFEGHIDEAELMNAYASCDIFVAPSRFESFGLVFVEAMRVAKPVIGCSAGGMTEVIVNDECGLLVAPGDVDQLAAAILRLVQSPSLRAAFGAAGQARFAQRFSADRMAAESISLYRRARQLSKEIRPNQ